VDTQELKVLGIVLKDNDILTEAYEKHKSQLIIPVLGITGVALDLNSLPIKPFSFKTVFLKWALQANEARIIAGREPLFTLGLVKACPLWKLVPPPFITMRLDKDSLLKQTGRNQPVIGKPMQGALKRSKG
jgi:hypothetical protein